MKHNLPTMNKSRSTAILGAPLGLQLDTDVSQPYFGKTGVQARNATASTVAFSQAKFIKKVDPIAQSIIKQNKLETMKY